MASRSWRPNGASRSRRLAELRLEGWPKDEKRPTRDEKSAGRFLLFFLVMASGPDTGPIETAGPTGETGEFVPLSIPPPINSRAASTSRSSPRTASRGGSGRGQCWFAAVPGDRSDIRICGCPATPKLSVISMRSPAWALSPNPIT